MAIYDNWKQAHITAVKVKECCWIKKWIF